MSRPPKMYVQKAFQESLSPQAFMQQLWKLYHTAKDKGDIKTAHDVMKTMASYAIGKPAKKIEITSNTTTVLEEYLAGRKPLMLQDPEVVDGEVRLINDNEGKEDGEEGREVH